LRYEDEIRKPDEFFNTIAADAVDEDQLAIMGQIIKRKTRPFEPGKFVDHYQAAVREMIDQKLQGRLPEKAPEQKPAQVINLMDALKRSLAQEEKSPEPAPRRAAGRSEREAPPTKPAARGRNGAAPNSQRSLLLPVEGGRARTRAEREAPTEGPRRRRKAS
jgi:DNA end-binding protein Ku